MKNELVVKDNALINASYNLEVTEQRLILLAIVNGRGLKDGITANSTIEIHASDYANLFNVSIDAAYKALKDAANSLFERKFTYAKPLDDYPQLKIYYVKSRWVSNIAYADDFASVALTFSTDVIPLISRLEKQFTSYQLKQVSQLTGKYAIRLYELLIAWRETGKTPQIELNDFRGKIGVETHEYTDMHNFKKRVLEPAINQINEHTDITVTYEQHKKGRTIIGFSFKFKQKSASKKKQPTLTPRDPKTVDMFTGQTDVETKTIAKAIVKDTVPPANPLQHRASRITTAIMSNKLHDRFKHGDEGISSTLRRIQAEIVNGGDETADFWQSKLEEFGVIFD